ncbi:hypothetical protein CPB84DRAFT_1402314 [Gymnopilus junonius]|uniref:Uncharacterized protein n=1 Tax=Gymnopilus junonius TaxID=109634 RepID=A0A9P5NJF7_GYMJU|nr:hypothetical protein CPB84DRAFT_1402314 [Gymnopilus junonius]
MVSDYQEPLQNGLNLPQEIIDLFIISLQSLPEREARRALAACTLVSQSVGVPARKLLHSTIVLSASRGPLLRVPQRDLRYAFGQQILALEDLINRNSSFASLIRKIQVEGGSSRLNILSETNNVAKVFDSLRLHAKNLDSISIAAKSGSPFALSNAGERFLKSYVGLITAVKLRHLQFTHIMDLPSQFVCNCSSLISLELNSTWMTNEKGLGIPLPDSASSLIQLVELTHVPNILNFHTNRSNINLSQLQRFKTSISIPTEADIAWESMWEARLSIKSLEILLHTRKNNIFDNSSLDIGKLPKLHNLRLSIQTGTHRTFPPLEDVLSILDPPTHPTSLHSIEVLFEYSTTAPDALRIPPNSDADKAWSLLEISNLRLKHIHLKRVS